MWRRCKALKAEFRCLVDQNRVLTWIFWNKREMTILLLRKIC